MALMPVGQIVRQWAGKAPERAAITCEDRSITWSELEVRTNRLARAYQELGVAQDDFVSIALPNGIEFYESAIAVLKLGATPHPLSAKLPWRERSAIVELANPSLIVGVEAGTHGARASVPPGHEPDARLSSEPLPDRAAKHWKLNSSGGSTGRPKLILNTNPALIDPEADPPMRVPRMSVQLIPGPLHHSAPYLTSFRGLLVGNHIVVMTRFNAEAALALIERHRVEWAVLVPTMMSRISKLDPDIRSRYDLSSLRMILHLGSSCPAWVKKRWIEWLGPERVHELYGASEGIIETWITGDEWLSHPGSVGRPVRCQIKILDEDGREAPTGEVGEVFSMPAPGFGNFRYLSDDPRRRRDGWETVGDLGWMDADGYLYIADRRVDMIVTGGANVYPAEVEAALDQHPDIRSSAIIGLPDDDLVSRVHAIVEASRPIDLEELRAFLAERLVRYKIPRTFEFVNEPLRDEAGKIRRSALRQSRLASTHASAPLFASGGTHTSDMHGKDNS
jgi:bile acid-coenzyme A ligase